MNFVAILAKAAMPCVLVGGGITAGAGVEPIKRAVHRAHRPAAVRHFKPAPRAAISTPLCEPIASSPVALALAEPSGGSSIYAAEPSAQRIGQWAGGNPPLSSGSGLFPFVPGTGSPDQPAPPAPPVSAIPEPSTWLTMLTGLTLVAAGFRMRRAAKRSAVA